MARLMPSGRCGLDGYVFTGYIVGELFVAEMSRYAALSLDGPRCLRAAEFVRINSAEGAAINLVGSPPCIRERDEWSASPNWMRVIERRRRLGPPRLCA